MAKLRRLSALQRKGLLTLSLLRSAALLSAPNAADAVAYHRFADRFGKFGGGGGDRASEAEEDGGGGSRGPSFARASREAARCSSSSYAEGGEAGGGGECPTGGPGPGPSLPPARLYPRSRLAKRVGGAAWEAYEECARERCPPCLESVPRGGHFQTASQGASASAAGAAAAEAAAASASLSSSSAPFGLPLNLWKVLFQAVLTTLNVLCWLIPLKSDRISSNKLALSLANAFSGGVFLSLAFGHLIPECVHGFPADGGHNEALPYMLVLAGYLLIFFVEKVAFDAHGLMHAGEEGHDEQGHHTHGHSHSHKKKEEGGAETAAAKKKKGGADDKAVVNGAKAGMAAVAERQDSGLATGRSAVILLGALAVHSVLEMTALGLASTFGESALLSLSIALHQPAESIALLVAFLKSGLPKPAVVRYLSIFSAMGPCGVALGMAVQEFAAPVVDAVMLAVVAGTFVYVGATEVIPEEWEDPEHKWKKFAALIGGIGTVFAITQYTMTLEA